MALKRLILLLPILVITITACSKQASNPVEIVAEVRSDGQNGPFSAPTETPDPDAITVIIGTALPFDEQPTDAPDQETFDAQSVDESTEEGEIEGFATATPFITSTPLPDVIMFTATPLPTQNQQSAIDAVGMETSTPFIQATQPVITPSSPLSGDSAIHTPTAQPEEIDEVEQLPSGLTDDEVTTIVTTPSTSGRPTLNPSGSGDETDTQTEPSATATEVPEECIHTVRRGDTVFKIALAKNTTVAAIQAVNPSLQPDLISLGQRIILPNCNVTPTPTVPAGATETAPTTGTGTLNETIHIVRSGDTLGRIARQYGVSLTVLVERNSISDPNRLSIGQEIIVPIPNN